jgi:hypothetical protein
VDFFVGQIEGHTSYFVQNRICKSLLCRKKPPRQPNRDLGTWLIRGLLMAVEGMLPCFDSQKNALCSITITLRSSGGLPAEPTPKRPVPDCVLSPINSTNLRRASTALGLLPDREPVLDFPLHAGAPPIYNFLRLRHSRHIIGLHPASIT